MAITIPEIAQHYPELSSDQVTSAVKKVFHSFMDKHHRACRQLMITRKTDRGKREAVREILKAARFAYVLSSEDLKGREIIELSMRSLNSTLIQSCHKQWEEFYARPSQEFSGLSDEEKAELFRRIDSELSK